VYQRSFCNSDLKTYNHNWQNHSNFS
jgi:hypothetical protein